MGALPIALDKAKTQDLIRFAPANGTLKAAMEPSATFQSAASTSILSSTAQSNSSTTSLFWSLPRTPTSAALTSALLVFLLPEKITAATLTATSLDGDSWSETHQHQLTRCKRLMARSGQRRRRRSNGANTNRLIPSALAIPESGLLAWVILVVRWCAATALVASTSSVSCLSAPGHARRSPESSPRFPSSSRGSRRELVVPSYRLIRLTSSTRRAESKPVNLQDLLLPMKLTAPNTTSVPAVE